MVRRFKRELLFYLVISTSCCSVSFSQNITKESILLEAKAMDVAPNKDSLFRWAVHEQTRKTLDDLVAEGVDSVVVYSVRHPAMWFGPKDSCTTMYTVYSYFFWVKNNKHKFIKVDGRCESKKKQVDDEVIQFAIDNYSQIKEEFFMPSTFIGEWKGKLRVKGDNFPHEPKYSIVIVLGKEYKYLTFNQNGLESKKSLFTDYNKSLFSFKLFKLIEKTIEEN